MSWILTPTDTFIDPWSQVLDELQLLQWFLHSIRQVTLMMLLISVYMRINDKFLYLHNLQNLNNTTTLWDDVR